MKAALKRIVSSFLLSNDIAISRALDTRPLLDFLASLRPVTTNHELIRIGGDSDGGYLIPDDLENVEFCFSPGVDVTADFESDLTKRGIKCFLADYSVDCPPIRNDLFDFEKKYLGQSDDDVFMTLENWVKKKAPEKSDFILQMDIEGAEYDVICDTSHETFRKFRILVIEFHELHRLYQRDFFRLVTIVFRKLLKNFHIVHIHPNNYAPPVKFRSLEIPPVMEFTFHRRDRVAWSTRTLSFPHKLDRKNDTTSPDYALPRCWYS
jgi:Methyltransferase FkbM domain